MGQQVTPIQARTVLRQEVAPADTEVLWMDTSGTTTTLKIHDSDTETWEPVVDITWADVADKPGTTQSRKLSGGYTVSRSGQIDSGNTITIQFDHFLDGVRVTGDRAFNWDVVDETGQTVVSLSTGRLETAEATFDGQVIDYVTLENTTGYSGQDWEINGHTPALPDHTHQL